jgi:hypothetical protein
VDPARPIAVIRRPEKEYFTFESMRDVVEEFTKELNDAVGEEVRRLVEEGYCNIDIPRTSEETDFTHPTEWSLCFSCGEENHPIAWWSLKDVLENLDVTDAPTKDREHLRGMLVAAIKAIDEAEPYEERDW